MSFFVDTQGNAHFDNHSFNPKATTQRITTKIAKRVLSPEDFSLWEKGETPSLQNLISNLVESEVLEKAYERMNLSEFKLWHHTMLLQQLYQDKEVRIEATMDKSLNPSVLMFMVFRFPENKEANEIMESLERRLEQSQAHGFSTEFVSHNGEYTEIRAILDISQLPTNYGEECKTKLYMHTFDARRGGFLVRYDENSSIEYDERIYPYAWNKQEYTDPNGDVYKPASRCIVGRVSDPFFVGFCSIPGRASFCVVNDTIVASGSDQDYNKIYDLYEELLEQAPNSLNVVLEITEDSVENIEEPVHLDNDIIAMVLETFAGDIVEAFLRPDGKFSNILNLEEHMTLYAQCHESIHGKEEKLSELWAKHLGTSFEQAKKQPVSWDNLPYWWTWDTIEFSSYTVHLKLVQTIKSFLNID